MSDGEIDLAGPVKGFDKVKAGDQVFANGEYRLLVQDRKTNMLIAIPIAEARVYHLKDGWVFARTPVGGVRICNYLKYNHEADLLISPSIWASIVAAVSARGEARETFDEAETLHMREQ